MKKINFKDFKMFTDISQSNTIQSDVSRELADTIYKNAHGIMAHDLAFRIYKSEGEIEMSNEEVEFIKNFLQNSTPLLQDSFLANLKED